MFVSNFLSFIGLDYGKHVASSQENSQSLGFVGEAYELIFEESSSYRKRHKGPAHVAPVAIRQDQTRHWPVWIGKRMRCKFPKCSGALETTCKKCGVVLCYSEHNNCFKQYHFRYIYDTVMSQSL